MVDPDRSLLEEVVEVDETEMPFRSKYDPINLSDGEEMLARKLFVIGTIRLSEEGYPRRIKPEPIPNRQRPYFHDFIARAVAPGAEVITDRHISYEKMPDTHTKFVSSRERRRTISCAGSIESSPA